MIMATDTEESKGEEVRSMRFFLDGQDLQNDICLTAYKYHSMLDHINWLHMQHFIVLCWKGNT